MPRPRGRRKSDPPIQDRRIQLHHRIYPYRNLNQFKPHREPIHVIRCNYDPDRFKRCPEEKELWYQCSICTQVFAQEDKADQHLSSVHGFQGRYVCPTNSEPCRTLTFTNATAIEHIQTAHPEQTSLVPQSLLIRIDLDCISEPEIKLGPEYSESNEIECLLCNSKVPNLRSLAVHLRRCIGYFKYQCLHCDHRTHYKRKLVQHLREHLDTLNQSRPRPLLPQIRRPENGYPIRMKQTARKSFPDGVTKFRSPSPPKKKYLHYNVLIQPSFVFWIQRILQLKISVQQFIDEERLFKVIDPYLDDPFDESGPQWSCSVCEEVHKELPRKFPFRFHTKEALRAHLSNHWFYRPYKCTICNMDYSSRSQTLRHFKSEHFNKLSLLEYQFTPIHKLERILDKQLEETAAQNDKRIKEEYAEKLKETERIAALLKEETKPSAKGLLTNSNETGCKYYAKLFKLHKFRKDRLKASKFKCIKPITEDAKPISVIPIRVASSDTKIIRSNEPPAIILDFEPEDENEQTANTQTDYPIYDIEDSEEDIEYNAANFEENLTKVSDSTSISELTLDRQTNSPSLSMDSSVEPLESLEAKSVQSEDSYFSNSSLDSYYQADINQEIRRNEPRHKVFVKGCGSVPIRMPISQRNFDMYCQPKLYIRRENGESLRRKLAPQKVKKIQEEKTEPDVRKIIGPEHFYPQVIMPKIFIKRISSSLVNEAARRNHQSF